MCRKPEHVFTCGHAIGEICVQIFGSAVLGYEYRYEIPSCVLCNKGSLTAELKPPTASVRILCIDGGGIGGAISLESLGLLQEVLGAACPIQDLFDMAFGTSSGKYLFLHHTNIKTLTNYSGGLIVLSLFLRNWNVQKSSTVFDTLSRKFFSKNPRQSRSPFAILRRAIYCWLSDGCYDVAAYEESLKESFGHEQRMFRQVESVSRSKVAVTATSISDASPFIFSNYNGAGMRPANCGKLLTCQTFVSKLTRQVTSISGPKIPKMSRLFGRRKFVSSKWITSLTDDRGRATSAAPL